MEKWFELKVSDDEPNQFDVEVIKLKRLLDYQDMNELLVLVEFILDILMRCERQQELVERIVSISDQAQQDLFELINKGADAEDVIEEETPFGLNEDARSDDTEYRKQAQMIKRIERLERKNEILKDNINMLEVENDDLRTKMVEQEKAR